MHLDVPLPEDLSIYASGEGTSSEGWVNCFVTYAETESACPAAGVDISETAYAPDAWHWRDEFSRDDPYCQANPEDEANIIQEVGGRWLRYGYVIARKPRSPLTIWLVFNSPLGGGVFSPRQL